jgi:pimeloyl-ACP methyl ester carboxylesterase
MDSTGLFVQRSGPENAPAIVFLHGGGVGGWMWQAQVERFNRQYRCLVPDLPGQANSKAAGPFSHARAADMVVDLIQREAFNGKAHVVGLSEGAQCTVELLSRASEVVDHAVISSALLRPMPSMWMYSRGMFAWSYRLFMAPFKNSDWWIRLNMQKAAGLPEEYYSKFKHSFQDTTEEEFVEVMYAGLHYRMPVGLGKATSRVLVVVGNNEYRQMKASGRDLLRVLPNARGVIVSLGPKARLPEEHNWAVTATDLFARTLQAWLESAPLPKELIDLTTVRVSG